MKRRCFTLWCQILILSKKHVPKLWVLLCTNVRSRRTRSSWHVPNPNLRSVLKEIIEDLEGGKIAGINLAWNYHKWECRLIMDGYIREPLLKYGHIMPLKPQLSPRKHREIVYGAKMQLAPNEDTSAKLDNKGILHIQGIASLLLYYGRAVDNKLLVALSSIGSQQASATKQTMNAMHPNSSILFCVSDMILPQRIQSSQSRWSSYLPFRRWPFPKI